MSVPAPPGFELSSDPARVDFDLVHTWLSTSYWAGGRSADTQRRANDGSTVYGVYREDDGRQVAFARVVTDRATYAWLCDVVVAEGLRSRGIGTWLVDTICADLAREGVNRVILATKDAHEVYARVGFRPLLRPHTWMERDRRPHQ